MSPPIRDGSGNSIGAIRLGDGSEISEVRTGAGDVLFSANAIPDSAIFAWPFDEGSGTSVRDEIGNADGTVNGATFVSGDFEGGFALDGDGTDDSIETTPWGDFGSNKFLNDWSIAFTVENMTGSGTIGGTNADDTSNDHYMYFSVGFRSNNVPELNLRDQNAIRTEVSGSTTINDGGKYRVLMGKSGNNPQDFDIYVNNSQENVTVEVDDGTLSSMIDFENAVSFLSESRNSGFSDFVNATIDYPIVYEAAPTSTLASDDFNLQPWS